MLADGSNRNRTNEEGDLDHGHHDSADDALAAFRERIDRVDEQLLSALAERTAICREVAEHKRAQGIPMMQPDRVAAVEARWAELAAERGLDADFARSLARAVVAENCRVEGTMMSDGDARRDGGGHERARQIRDGDRPRRDRRARPRAGDRLLPRRARLRAAGTAPDQRAHQRHGLGRDGGRRRQVRARAGRLAGVERLALHRGVRARACSTSRSRCPIRRRRSTT